MLMDPKEQQRWYSFFTSTIAGAARARLNTTTNCLRDFNSRFFLKVYS